MAETMFGNARRVRRRRRGARRTVLGAAAVAIAVSVLSAPPAWSSASTATGGPTGAEARAPSNPPRIHAVQWGLQNIDYPGVDINIVPAWEHARGEGMVVATIDSGVYSEHNAFEDDSPAFVQGHNFMEGDPEDVSDEVGHGTGVAGAIAARDNGGRDITGVAPHAQIMPLRIAHSGGVLGNPASAIHHAINMHADVINISATFASFSADFAEAIDRAGAAGIPIVVGPSNQARDLDEEPLDDYPAHFAVDHSNVIVVTAIDQAGQLGPNLPWGARTVTLGAPGIDVQLPTIGGVDSYRRASGTSVAAPLVSGAVALMRQVNPVLSPSRIRDILTATATPLHSLAGRTVAGGMLNTGAAVDQAHREHRDLLRGIYTMRPNDDRLRAVTATESAPGAVGLQDAAVPTEANWNLQRFTVEQASNGSREDLRFRFFGTELILAWNSATREVGLADPVNAAAETRWRLVMRADQRTYDILPFGEDRYALDVTSERMLYLGDWRFAPGFELASTSGGELSNASVLLRDASDPDFGLAYVEGVLHMSEWTPEVGWTFEWNHRLGAYRVAWRQNPNAALAPHADDAVLLYGAGLQTHWIPRRAANGSLTLLNAVDPTRALSRQPHDVTTRVHLAEERPGLEDPLTRWQWELTCSDQRAVQPGCEAPAPIDSISRFAATIRAISPNDPDSRRLGLDATGPEVLLRSAGWHLRMRWALEPDGDYYTIRNGLDYYLSHTSTGQITATTPGDDSADKRWNIVANAYGTYSITTAESNAFLTWHESYLTDGAGLRLSATPVATSWDFTWTGDTVCDLFADCAGPLALATADDTDLVLDAQNGGVVTLWTYHGGSNQRLHATWDPNRGAYTFTFDSSGNNLAWTSHAGSGVCHCSGDWDDQYWIPWQDGKQGWVLSNYKDRTQVLQRSMIDPRTEDGRNVLVTTYNDRSHSNAQHWIKRW